MKHFLTTLILITISTPALAKRKAPEPVKPLIHKGLKFEVPHFGWRHEKSRGQNGGFVLVKNAGTDTALCLKKIYAVKYKPRLEKDVQDNFITRLEILEKHLIVHDERGNTYKTKLEFLCEGS